MYAAPSPFDLLEQRFPTEEAARAFLEKERWPNGPVCPHCENRDTVYSVKANPQARIRSGLFKCGACKSTFTVTVGTVMEDSHIPLRKWLAAFYLYSESRGAIKVAQLKEKLRLGSYRSAKHLCDRIRLACYGEVDDDGASAPSAHALVCSVQSKSARRAGG